MALAGTILLGFSVFHFMAYEIGSKLLWSGGYADHWTVACGLCGVVAIYLLTFAYVRARLRDINPNAPSNVRASLMIVASAVPLLGTYIYWRLLCVRGEESNVGH